MAGFSFYLTVVILKRMVQIFKNIL